jgi:hypothetical protein
MRGCVGKDDVGNYVLQPTRGLRVRLISNEDLARHLGHEVRAVGTFPNSQQNSSSKPSNSAGSSAKNRLPAEREFRVLRLDTISQTCRVTAKKK